MTKLKTGQTYTLSELLSGERRIIIPDLQRDYCWGGHRDTKEDVITGELVSDFVRGLMDLFEQKPQDTTHLGLFYGYESPKNHIQLCDAQQRFTTLYLLLGMLHKQVGQFRHYLLSDEEYEQDDKEPYLQYAIRESSLYFFCDLVSEFFMKREATVKDIRKADWYFADYDFDPTIQSMLLALETIEGILRDKSDAWQVDFGGWLLDKLVLMYVDMESRQNGEETFVVINTTGEPLSTTENLKPLVLSAFEEGERKEWSKKWEEMETWFWSYRQGENDTADVGFAEFLRWVSIIEHSVGSVSSNEQAIKSLLHSKGKQQFPYKEVDLKTIYDYWKSLKRVVNLGTSYIQWSKDLLSPQKRKIEQKECFILLPLLRFVYQHLSSQLAERQVIRVGKFFENSYRVKENIDLVPKALLLVDQIAGADIISLINLAAGNQEILSTEEVRKLCLLKSADNREAMEEKFWHLEAHPMWNGKIEQVIEWATAAELFDFDKFVDYSLLLSVLFPNQQGKVKHDALTQTLRRCMIACSDSYTPLKRGGYYTFGWEWGDWKKLFERKAAKAFVDELIDNRLWEHRKDTEHIISVLEKYITDHLTEGEYSDFAKDNYLLSFMSDTHASDIFLSERGWQMTVRGSTARHNAFLSQWNAEILRLFAAGYQNKYGHSKQIENGWSLWYWSSSPQNNCVVFQYSGIKLDTRCISYDKQQNKATVTLHVKTTDNKTDLSQLHPRLLEAFDKPSDYSREVVKEYTWSSSAIKEELEKIMQIVAEALSKP